MQSSKATEFSSYIDFVSNDQKNRAATKLQQPGVHIASNSYSQKEGDNAAGIRFQVFWVVFL